MWSVPYYRELSQNADTQPPIINTIYLEKQPLLLEKYLGNASKVLFLRDCRQVDTMPVQS